MATVSSSSDQTADLLQNLTLDSEAKTATKAREFANKGLYGDNSAFIYNQGYGYQFGMYPALGDGQMQGLQQYQYPSAYYQPYTPQGASSTSVGADQVPFSIEANKGNHNVVENASGVSGNNGSKQLRPSYQYLYSDPNGSQRRGGLSTVVPSPSYQDPRFSYDGMHSPIPWVDTSPYSGAQAKHAANSAFTSAVPHTSNFQSGRNQNHYSHPHAMNLHNTRPTSGFGDTFDYMNQMYQNNGMYGQYGNSFRAGSGYGSSGYDSWVNGRGWYTVDNRFKPRGRGNFASGSGKESVDGLNEMNKGPRTKGFKNQEGSDPLAVKGQNILSSESNKEGNSSPKLDKEKYSGDEFPENYTDAKFFVIKSYSEDDVHKSIKYNMWTSTANGNKKLDAAYREAKGKSSDCPVFLLFSVNASGQFVGLAEMVGPVDFEKTVEYWQQDKWTGCFPLKWHIIKDVPNSSLRHITLENNENKPVTNSRDTQEVNLEQGIQIIEILKGYSSKRSILDDFGFYEARESIMQQKKAKQQQIQKQVSEGKPTEAARDEKDRDVTTAKDTVQKPVTSETKGELKKLEGVESAVAVEDAPISAKPAVLPEKKGSPNGVASAC